MMKRLIIWAAALLVPFTILVANVAAVDLTPDKICDPNARPVCVEICKSGSSATACSNEQQQLSGPQGIILRAANIIAVIAGIAAVITIMVAGFVFITAAGDSSKISSAKTMITYAIVGILVIFLARTIVAFIVLRV